MVGGLFRPCTGEYSRCRIARDEIQTLGDDDMAVVDTVYIFFVDILHCLLLVDTVKGELHKTVYLFENFQFPLLIHQPTGYSLP
jgi:hypothetical protein